MTSTRLSRRRFAAALAVPTLLPRAPSARAARQDATTLLAEAAANMAALDSFHFELSTPRGTTRILDAFQVVRLEGDVQRPDRFQATIDAEAVGFDLSIEAIGVGDTLWITDPMAGGEFREVPLDTTASDGGPTLEQIVNPDRLWVAALRVITEPVVVGQDTIDGEPVTRVDGFVDVRQVIDPERAAGVVGTPTTTTATDQLDFLPDRLPVSIWITEERLLRRLEIEGPLLADEEPSIVRRLDLTRFDEPVTIEPPVAG